MAEPTRQTLSRADFLRLGGLASGLGALALAGCGNNAPDIAEEERRGYVVAVTHGPDDPARVMLALFTATRLPEGDNHVWFAIDGGQVAKLEEAKKITSPLFEKQGTAADLLEQIGARGTAFHI